MNPSLTSSHAGHHLSLRSSSRLESLRGLAAIQVAMLHCLLVLESSHSSQALVPFMIVIFNGRAAVTLFFVLSGLVLGLSLRRTTTRFDHTCASYVVRRVFRIYPAFILTSLLIAALIPVYRTLPGTDSQWMNTYFPTSFTLHSLWQNLSMIDLTFSRVTWTLRMEMVCSLLLPVCYYAGLLSRMLPWALLLASVGIALHFRTTVSAAVVQAFLIGFLIPEISGLWRRCDRNIFSSILFSVLGLALLLLPRSSHFPLPIITLLEAMGAALIINCVTNGFDLSLHTILDNHLVKVAGRISYSYYLLHPIALFPVVTVLLPLLQAATGNRYSVLCAFVLWLGSSAIAFPLAWLSYQWVEKPLINFSKSLLPRPLLAQPHAASTKVAVDVHSKAQVN